MKRKAQKQQEEYDRLEQMFEDYLSKYNKTYYKK